MIRPASTCSNTCSDSFTAKYSSSLFLILPGINAAFSSAMNYSYKRQFSKKACRAIKSRNIGTYSVLEVITDGQIKWNDRRRCVDG